MGVPPYTGDLLAPSADGAGTYRGSRPLNTRFLRSGIFTLVLVVGIAAVLYMFLFDQPKPDTIAYSGGTESFLGYVSEGAVDKVVQSGNALEITLKENDPKTGQGCGRGQPGARPARPGPAGRHRRRLQPAGIRL